MLSFLTKCVQSKLDEKRTLLLKAIQSHTTLTREAATGRGIDRHLLGLRLVMKPDEKCDLFSDPLFFSESRVETEYQWT